MNNIQTMAGITYPAKTKFLTQNMFPQYLYNSFSFYSVQQSDWGSEKINHIMNDKIYAEEDNGKSMEDCSLSSVQ